MFKGFGIGILTLALVFSFTRGAQAALTLGALTAASDGALTITTAVGSAGNLFTTTTTGAINIGTAQTTGALTIGGAQTTGSISITSGSGDMILSSTDDLSILGGSAGSVLSIGTNTHGNVINIATDDTTADTVTIGSAKDTLVLVGASITAGAAGDGTGLNYFEETETVSATDTLTTAESGKVLYMSGGSQVYTLPSPANGVIYTFVVAGALGGDALIYTGGDNIIEGSLIVSGAVVDCDAEDTIVFDATGENVGDYVVLRSDGTSWFITGSNALTATKLSCDAS